MSIVQSTQAKGMGRIFTRNSTYSESQENVMPIFILLYTYVHIQLPIQLPIKQKVIRNLEVALIF
jgi:hypothetical protein